MAVFSVVIAESSCTRCDHRTPNRRDKLTPASCSEALSTANGSLSPNLAPGSPSAAADGIILANTNSKFLQCVQNGRPAVVEWITVWVRSTPCEHARSFSPVTTYSWSRFHAMAQCGLAQPKLVISVSRGFSTNPVLLTLLRCKAAPCLLASSPSSTRRPTFSLSAQPGSPRLRTSGTHPDGCGDIEGLLS
jgi:hypothetical protein